MQTGPERPPTAMQTAASANGQAVSRTLYVCGSVACVLGQLLLGAWETIRAVTEPRPWGQTEAAAGTQLRLLRTQGSVQDRGPQTLGREAAGQWLPVVGSASGPT